VYKTIQILSIGLITALLLTACGENKQAMPAAAPAAAPAASEPVKQVEPLALEYVQDKKWSLGPMSCDLRGGSYFIYTKDRGLVQIAGGKELKSTAPMTFEYVQSSPSGFTYKQIYFANDLVANFLHEPKAISAELEKRITLVDGGKIIYHSKIKQLNFDKMMKGIKEYEITEEDGFSNLCNF